MLLVLGCSTHIQLDGWFQPGIYSPSHIRRPQAIQTKTIFNQRNSQNKITKIWKENRMFQDFLLDWFFFWEWQAVGVHLLRRMNVSEEIYIYIYIYLYIYICTSFVAYQRLVSTCLFIYIYTHLIFLSPMHNFMHRHLNIYIYIHVYAWNNALS